MVSHEEDIRYMLGRLEGKVDSLITGMKATTHTIHEHEKRLRVLETSKAWILGWFSAAALLISVIIQFLFKNK